MAANADGTAGAPVHLVIGHAGAGLCLNTLPVRPQFWERVELTHGYMRVNANGTHMHCEVCIQDSAATALFLYSAPDYSTNTKYCALNKYSIFG